jgi:transcription elongation factor Elf1
MKGVKMAQKDTRYTQKPTCPHCGDEMEDAWELELDDGGVSETDCGNCEKPMFVTMHCMVTYSTQAT